MSAEQITIPIDLLKSLIDGDGCWFDHHGGCQAHGYLWLEPGEKCPHMEAKERLAEAGHADKDWEMVRA